MKKLSLKNIHVQSFVTIPEAIVAKGGGHTNDPCNGSFVAASERLDRTCNGQC